MLRYDDYGSGLPVVLIHGFPLNRQMWRPQIDALTEAGYRVICPDLPGFGETPADDTSSMSSYADGVIALLDSLKIEKAVIGGMSMGGYVLLEIAARHPERLMGAMFLMTRAAADDEAGKEKRSMLAEEARNGNLTVVPEAFAQVLFAPETPVQKPELVNEVRQWMESTSAEGVIGGLLAMRDRHDFVDRLPEFNVPCLVVGAEKDLAVPLEHSYTLASGLSSANLNVIQGAGHMANLEQPELFNQALVSFLQSLGEVN